MQYVTIRPARLFFNYEPPSETIYFPLLSSFPFNRPLYVHITRTILTRSTWKIVVTNSESIRLINSLYFPPCCSIIRGTFKFRITFKELNFTTDCFIDGFNHSRRERSLSNEYKKIIIIFLYGYQKKRGGRENYSIPKSWLKFRRLFDHSFPLEKRSICWSLGVKTTIKVSLREIGYTRILRHPFIPPYRKRLLEAISWAARRASCDLGAHSNGLERGPRNFHHRNHCREDSL